MAPEQLTAPDAAQASADLFSLSVIFYELLVGVVPQSYWQPPSGGRADVPVAIDQLIQKGLSPSPRTRQQTVAEYRDALEAAMKSRPPSSATGTWADRPEVQDAIRKTTEFFVKGGLANRGDKDAAGSVTPPAGDRSLWNWFIYAVTKRYADGKGRAHRKEYWGFNIGAFALIIGASVVDFVEAMEGGRGGDDSGYGGEPSYGGEYYDAYGYPVDAPANDFMELASSPIVPIVTIVVWLLLLIPSIAIASRRMHYLGYSGWSAALLAIPGLGLVISVLLGLPRGAPGANAYGPDPLTPEGNA
jgi:uncharacterized membrane protein YhaH (DUF805 family)